MTSSDFDAVIALWRATEGIGLSDADSREKIAVYLERNPGMSFVAESDGRMAGTVLCGHDGRRGYLYHLAVAPEFRRHGLARALVAAGLGALCAAGIEKCHLFVFRENLEASAFYARTGWVERDDLRVMSRLLPAAGGDEAAGGGR